MSPYAEPGVEDYLRAKAKAKRRPAWLLRRRECRIVKKRFPESAELSELAAIRSVLRKRGARPALVPA
jgi:hypothetical protein